MTKRTVPMHLYLVKTSELKMLTEAEAAHLSFMEECDVWNVTESLEMEPELVEIDD